MFTPPTRRNSTVSSRRRRRCVLDIIVSHWGKVPQSRKKTTKFHTWQPDRSRPTVCFLRLWKLRSQHKKEVWAWKGYDCDKKGWKRNEVKKWKGAGESVNSHIFRLVTTGENAMITAIWFRLVGCYFWCPLKAMNMFLYVYVQCC